MTKFAARLALALAATLAFSKIAKPEFAGFLVFWLCMIAWAGLSEDRK